MATHHPDTVGEQRWLQLAYHDVTWVQRLDGPNSTPGRPAASCIQPRLATRMLAALAANPGDQILEIGAGTGWLTALLSYRCGADHVTAIEIDPELIRQAQTMLSRLGHKPRLVCTDGSHGFPDHAPYNAILSTAAVSHIPKSWLHQTRPGARIVTPLRGAIAVINVDNHTHATGSFLPEPTQFLSLRSSKSVTLGTSATQTQPDTEASSTMPVIRDPQFRAFLELAHPKLTINNQGLLGDTSTLDEQGELLQISPLGQVCSKQQHILTTINHIHQQWVRAGQPNLADLIIEINESGQWIRPPGTNPMQRWLIR